MKWIWYSPSNEVKKSSEVFWDAEEAVLLARDDHRRHGELQQNSNYWGFLGKFLKLYTTENMSSEYTFSSLHRWGNGDAKIRLD